MSVVLIIGETGSGKSSAIQTLNPKETFLIKCYKKRLPFASNKKFTITSGDDCNCYITYNWQQIVSILDRIREAKKHIKNIVLDDFQYMMSGEAMDRAMEKGYGKFSELADHVRKVIDKCNELEDKYNIFMLSHSIKDDYGVNKALTVGKILDNMMRMEGLFTFVLFSVYENEKHVFATQGMNISSAKTPAGIFEDKYIPNDLQLVADKIDEYYNEDINM